MKKLSTALKVSLQSYLPALAIAGLLLAGPTLNSCTKKDDPATPAAPLTIKVATSANVGKYLTDGDGNTLYYYGRDVNGPNACTGGCATVWPVFYEASVTVGPELNAADFTTVKTASGQNQTLYKGWPLYYYAPSTNGQPMREPTGTISGEGIGGVWFVARPDYSVMVARNTVVNKSTNQSSTRTYLIDSQGRTLYTSGKDSRLPATQPTNCQGGCITAWPVFYQANIVAPSLLKASDFSTITRPDGPNGTTQLQTTYKGMPLYYFTNDTGRGKVEGDGIGTTDMWTVATP